MNTNLNADDQDELNDAPIRLADIYLFSLQLEARSKNLYAKLSERMQDPRVKGLFFILADEETKHGDYFQDKIKGLKIQGKKEIKTEVLRELVLMMRQKLFDPNILRKKLEKIDEFDSIMDFAIGMEMDQILYYQEIRDHVEKNIQSSIDELIAEEKKHYLKLQKFKNMGLV
jgi:rubrerythrin